ncbi:TIM barrel protein [Paenibacillus sp. P25]|nr:TIM barrel protein [Paenibacillus sp. P25]
MSAQAASRTWRRIWQPSIDKLAALAELAGGYGVTLCVKAHVGQSIYNTPTTLRAIEAIPNASFGIDMDPSHIYRANENPEEAAPQVVSRVRHIHIRDCKGRQAGPGPIELQACGRGISICSATARYWLKAATTARCAWK